MAKKLKKPAPISTLRTYHFGPKDKDPVIGQVFALMAEGAYSKKDIHNRCGISMTTLYNWEDGPTRKPQWASVVGVIRSMGYDAALVPLSADEYKTVKALKELDATPPRLTTRPMGRPPVQKPATTSVSL